MRVWPVGAAAGVLAVALTAACSNPLGPKYEYEEQLYLGVDGAANVVIDSSLPALVVLHGLAIDPQPRSRVDRNLIKAIFEKAGCPDVRVGQPWVRSGRHFVQVQVSTPDVRTLKTCAPLAWSSYVFEKGEAGIRYHQVVGPRTTTSTLTTNWDGKELVGFKLHLPSKIQFHNVKRLADGSNGDVDRGNILTYEQRLTDRIKGTPVDMEARMGSQSILYQTLWLFGGAFASAVIVLVALIWITVSRAKRRAKLNQH